MSRRVSADRGSTLLARTVDGKMVVVGEVDRQALAADVVIIERTEGRSEIARIAGRVAPEDDLPVEARIIRAHRISADGQPLGELLDELPVFVPKDRGWGALGLPQGLDTRVVPSTIDDLADDYAMARSSRSMSALALQPVLALAPGESVTAGARSGVITAVDRRAGTIELQMDDGERATVAIDDLHQTGDQEQEP